MCNSWPDIAKKLQKIENWKDKSLDELLREAQKVHVRQNEDKQKQKAKIMLATRGRPLERKMLLKKPNTNPPKNLGKDCRVHRPQGERKKTNVINVENWDISGRNVLKGKRKRR
jgi:hypothetical protein